MSQSRGPEGRVPPHNISAEESALGSFLLSRDALFNAMERGLAVADFYKPQHQIVYEAMRHLVEAGQFVDAVTLGDELRREGRVDELGGDLSLLLELQHATPSISGAARYVKIVQETAMMRRLIGVAAEVAEIGYSEPDDVEGALDAAKLKLLEVADTGGWAPDMTGFYDSVDEMPDTIRAEWVADQLLCKGEVMTCTAGGGLGKSTIGRWFAYAAENGLHPWFGRRANCGISRTLVVDLETQPYNIKESSGIMVNKIAHIQGIEMNEVFHPAILQRRGRLDLRKRSDRSTIREAIKRSRPSLVVMGPLKNLFLEQQNEAYAQAALETQDILMQLMTDYGFGLYLEAHGSKGSKQATAGSQRWEDWPDMAIGLEIADADAPPSKDRNYNEALTEFCQKGREGEMALKVTRNREPRNSGMIVPKLLIRSPHRILPFTVAC